MSVDSNLAGIGFPEFEEQIRGGGFSGAGWPRNGGDLTGFGGERNAAQHLAIGPVGEGDVAELHGAGSGRQFGAGQFQGVGVQQADGAVQRRHVLLHSDRDAAERIDGIVDAVQIGDEHDDVAGRQAAVQDHPAAVTQHEGLARWLRAVCRNR